LNPFLKNNRKTGGKRGLKKQRKFLSPPPQPGHFSLETWRLVLKTCYYQEWLLSKVACALSEHDISPT